MVIGQTDAETMRRALDAGAATSYACMGMTLVQMT
jgi:hypothetical protein